MARKKQKIPINKVKIEYPPLTLRKWIPPDRRAKKKPPPKYVKPPGITQKLKISSLGKIWNNFKIVYDRTVLLGCYSETHKRFRPRSNGYQTPCNCIIAVAFSTLYPMAKWGWWTIDTILQLGDQLYMTSVQHLDDRGRTYIHLLEVYNTFLLGCTKITMNVKGKTYQGKLFEDFEQTPFLVNVIKDFFNDKHTAGIICIQKKYMAFWTDGKRYYFFDPAEHDQYGYPWKGIISRGYAVVMRVKDTDELVKIIHENTDQSANSKFLMFPCSIVRMVSLNTEPPTNIRINTHCGEIEEVTPKTLPTLIKKTEKEEEEEEEKEVKDLTQEDEEGPPYEEIFEYAPEAAEKSSLQQPPAITASKIPIERPKAESITHFSVVSDGIIGILRASTFQGDTRFSKYKGAQSLANAVAALTMLRICKSKYWFRKMLDEILLLGEEIHGITLKNLKGQSLKVTTIHEKIPFQGYIFTPKVDEITVVGKLQSQHKDILDLLPALEEFFREYDTGVITGPLSLAVWKEDGYYYMFDPNERDQNGLAIVKNIQIGSEIKVTDYTPGVASLMWFKDLNNLTKVYMNNTDRTLKREPFIISNVQINDYVDVPQAWGNFEGIAPGKWILRGTFNQNNRRFDKETRNAQSTAAAIVALSFSKLKHVKNWTTEDLDEILIQGDAYYKKCIEALQESGKFVSNKLMVDEVQRRFPLEGYEMSLSIQDCMFNGLLDARDENDALNLKTGLTEFFKDNDTCVVSVRNIAVAVWKVDGIYYYYDSHSRDEDGVIANFGTACTLRILDIANLAKAIESNLSPGTTNVFNISNIIATIFEVTESGLGRPPLNNFTELGSTSAILRSLYHERSPEFKLNVGKQTIPMCLAAAGMIKLYPPLIWSRDIVDEIMRIGDKLYTDTMIQREKTSNLSEEDDIDEVYAENCLMKFNIGVNKFSFSYDSPLEGDFQNDFKNSMTLFFNEMDDNEENQKELLVASDVYTVFTWKEQGVYFLFDPKPRDGEGQVYGKGEWKLRVEEGEDGEDGTISNLHSHQGAGDASVVESKASAQEDKKKRSVASQASEDFEGEVSKHTSLYWRTQEEEDGKACTMWFLTMDTLIGHILGNTPPTKREDITFKLYPVNVSNKADIKHVFNPEGEREDNYSGDWYAFKELDHGRWILRGTMNLNDEMFPNHNRGKQSVAMCYAALAYVKRFALIKFKSITVDDILKYGDRLLSATRRIEFNILKKKKELDFTEEEIEARLNKMDWGIYDTARAFCIGPDQMQADVSPEYINGELYAQDDQEIFDVKRGLVKYFAEHRAGILNAKNLAVAVWKGINVYYMFDPDSRGPNGIKCTNGEACITRYLDIGNLVNVFLKNLPKEGKNTFTIHLVKMRIVRCPREPKPEEKERAEERPKYDSYIMVMPGKSILRGTLSQEDPSFGRGRNAQCAPIAVVALTMTLIHKASLWTKPIIDEILMIGDELYVATLDTLGFQFNPWEQGMTVHLVNKDYKIGTTNANCELRTMDQRGIIDIKHPKILNLRQGIENFFEENTHGIIETETLTVAIWEEEDQANLIYMFDPNPRGPAGLPFSGGTACVLTFESAKMAADHFISNIADKSKRSGEFVITPVEIVVGNARTKIKQKMKDQICPCYAEFTNIKAPSPTQSKKKKLRKMAEQERAKKEAARIAKLGKFEYHPLSNGDAILRGCKSQTWHGYTITSRGNQDIPNCLAAFVMHRLIPISMWYCRHIDMILDVGDQLYKDSYITYDPRNPKLGFKNVLRRVFIKEVKVTLSIYRPVLSNVLTAYNLELALVNYFQQEAFGILFANNQYVGLFFKEGYYYMFDSHDRDAEGNACESGNACVIKFESIPNLVIKFMENVVTLTDSMKNFSITLVTIGAISKSGVIDTT